jgi:hypothetical protein
MVGYDNGAFASDVDTVMVVIIPRWRLVLEVDAVTVAGADDVMIIVIVVVVLVVLVVLVVVAVIVALASSPIIVASNDAPMMM